jgi:hypothetical protein
MEPPVRGPLECSATARSHFCTPHPNEVLNTGDIAKALNANRDTIAAGLSHIARASDVTEG